MNTSIQQDASLSAASQKKGKYLTFYTDNQRMGIPIEDVVQIIGMQPITQIPEFPVYAKGIIPLRGTIIPVIDMRMRLGKAEKEYDERTCIIVASVGETAVGFIVDAVDAVTAIHPENISPAPRLGGDAAGTLLTGVARHEGNVILLLSSAQILSEEAMENIALQLQAAGV